MSLITLNTIGLVLSTHGLTSRAFKEPFWSSPCLTLQHLKKTSFRHKQNRHYITFEWPSHSFLEGWHLLLANSQEGKKHALEKRKTWELYPSAAYYLGLVVWGWRKSYLILYSNPMVPINIRVHFIPSVMANYGRVLNSDQNYVLKIIAVGALRNLQGEDRPREEAEPS